MDDIVLEPIKYADRYEELLQSFANSRNQGLNEEIIEDTQFKETQIVMEICSNKLNQSEPPREEFQADILSKVSMLETLIRNSKNMVSPRTVCIKYLYVN